VFAPDDSNGNDQTASQKRHQPGGGGSPSTAERPAASDPTDPTESTESSTTEPSTTDPETTPAAGSPAEAEDFVQTYYTLVPDDTDAGWSQLSPRYQAETSREAYDDFWGSFDSVDVSDVHAVSPTVVNYTISYDGSSPESKTITLVRDGSSYLIDSDGQQG
jgi:eukaryotic-like serine/threonine-protein kinase